MINIRRAEKKDTDNIEKLLYQVHKVHSDKRPDIFKSGMKKYTSQEIERLVEDDDNPVFVSVDGNDQVTGYVFCVYMKTEGTASLVERETLFIDDFCVDSNMRGQNIGGALYRFVEKEAERKGCDSITLNVWNFNEGARKFYERLGFLPLKLVMEKKMKE